jgi:hypothetical protein
MKRFRVAASYTQPLDVVVLAPNDWDENDVMEYYRANGADGEFVEDHSECEWTWGDATELNKEEYSERLVHRQGNAEFKLFYAQQIKSGGLS